MGRHVRDKSAGAASPASSKVADGAARRAHARSLPAYKVVDDFPSELPVAEAELAAIEAFLGPLFRAIFADEHDDVEPKFRANAAPR